MDQIARTPKQLAETLRRRRRELGLSQGALGSQISLRQSTISAMEGARDIRLSTLFNTLAALKLELVVRPRTKGSASDIAALF